MSSKLGEAVDLLATGVEAFRQSSQALLGNGDETEVKSWLQSITRMENSCLPVFRAGKQRVGELESANAAGEERLREVEKVHYEKVAALEAALAKSREEAEAKNAENVVLKQQLKAAEEEAEKAKSELGSQQESLRRAEREAEEAKAAAIESKHSHDTYLSNLEKVTQNLGINPSTPSSATPQTQNSHMASATTPREYQNPTPPLSNTAPCTQALSAQQMQDVVSSPSQRPQLREAVIVTWSEDGKTPALASLHIAAQTWVVETIKTSTKAMQALRDQKLRRKPMCLWARALGKTPNEWGSDKDATEAYGQCVVRRLPCLWQAKNDHLVKGKQQVKGSKKPSKEVLKLLPLPVESRPTGTLRVCLEFWKQNEAEVAEIEDDNDDDHEMDEEDDGNMMEG